MPAASTRSCSLIVTKTVAALTEAAAYMSPMECEISPSNRQRNGTCISFDIGTVEATSTPEYAVFLVIFPRYIRQILHLR